MVVTRPSPGTWAPAGFVDRLPNRTRLLAWAAAGLLAVGVLDVLALSGIVGPRPSTPPPSSSPVLRLEQVADQYVRDRDVFLAAENKVTRSESLLASDITRQQQRIQGDENVYGANVLGVGCISVITATNPTVYPTCVNQEEASAASAQSDEAAADTQIINDQQQLSTLASDISGNIDTFVNQLSGIEWPKGNVDTQARRLSAALIQERSDFTREVATYSGTDPQNGGVYTTRVVTDEANVESDAVELDVALGLSTSQATQKAPG